MLLHVRVFASQAPLFQKLSDRLVPAFCRVHKALGPGLLEAVYEEAMAIELDHLGGCRLRLPFERQKEFPVFYRLKPAGVYVADLVVDGKIVLDGPSHGLRRFGSWTGFMRRSCLTT